MEARKARLLTILTGLVVVTAGLGLLAWRMDVVGLASTYLDVVRESGAPIFFIAMLILPLFGFPLSPFIFSAGPLFGPTMGAPAVIGCCIGAVAGNVSLAYWLGGRALRPLLERLITWMGYSVPGLEKANSWEFTLLLRIVPGVPFFIQSYLLGLARVRLGTYLLISILVPAGYIMATVLAGDALVQHQHKQLVVAGVIFAVVGVVLHRLRKRYAAKKRSQGSVG